MSTLLEDRPETLTDHGGTGNEDPKVAHYCRKDKIADAYVFGEELEAICGEKFIPSRDPENLPVCEACKAIAESLPE